MTLDDYRERILKPTVDRMRAKMRRDFAADLRRIRRHDTALARRYWSAIKGDGEISDADSRAVWDIRWSVGTRTTDADKGTATYLRITMPEDYR